LAWDFSTEPEFQRKLDWMAGFVRTEVWAGIYDRPDEVHRQSVARRILRGYAGRSTGCPASTCRRAGLPRASASRVCSRR
jgi:hypothetical protein